jgi:hypothetical protein
MRWMRRVPLLILVLAGCSGGSTATQTPGDPEPAFQLQDVNENSTTFGTDVSPRNHMGRVSAWYFGRST